MPATASSPKPPVVDGLVTSLRVISGMLWISATTVVDAARNTVSREVCDRRLGWWGRQVVRDAGIDLRVRGLEYLADKKPYVVMSNHQSHFDIPVLFASVGSDVRMVTKTELFRVPVWGPAMKASGFIEIDRRDRHKAIESLRNARASVERGVRIWIAPEGTRSRTGELLPFKKGGFVVAQDGKIPILPVGLAGTRDVLPADTILSRRGQRVGVVVGPPIAVEGKTREALMVETRAAIERAVAAAEALRNEHAAPSGRDARGERQSPAA